MLDLDLAVLLVIPAGAPKAVSSNQGPALCFVCGRFRRLPFMSASAPHRSPKMSYSTSPSRPWTR